jgi:hypothetical protein
LRWLAILRRLFQNWEGEWSGALRSLQPIYQVAQRYVLGKVLGPAQGVDQMQLVARPGYAVGTIRIQSGLALNALQVEFHPRSDKLPPDAKPYSSPWFGSLGGAPYQLTNGPFVGVDACVHGEIIGLQLVRAGAPEE